MDRPRDVTVLALLLDLERFFSGALEDLLARQPHENDANGIVLECTTKLQDAYQDVTTSRDFVPFEHLPPLAPLLAAFGKADGDSFLKEITRIFQTESQVKGIVVVTHAGYFFALTCFLLVQVSLRQAHYEVNSDNAGDIIRSLTGLLNGLQFFFEVNPFLPFDGVPRGRPNRMQEYLTHIATP